MNQQTARILVLVGERFACVKIIGRANFHSSIDFRTLIHELRQKGYEYFVLDLAECTLMDSTFLGVIAGLGLKLGAGQKDPCSSGIELLNPNPRVIGLLENLGVLHLFKVSQGLAPAAEQGTAVEAPRSEPSKADLTRACLEAHRTLMEINPANIAKFKEVTQFLAEDLRHLSPEP